MNMDKLIQCRICLVENVRMYVVANKNLQETYKKLTDVPFVTKDRRPLLACYFCYTKLKQSWRLQRKCLEAEEWFTQVLSEDCEASPQLNQEKLKFSGYGISPIKHVSIYDEFEIENVTIKEELPDDCEEQDASGKQKEDYQKDSEKTFQERPSVSVKIEVEDSNAPTNDSNREDIPPKQSQLPPQYTSVVDLKIEVQEDTPTQIPESEDSTKISEQDPIDFTPFLDLKIEVEEEQGTAPRQFPEPEYIVPQHSMMEFNTEVEQDMAKKQAEMAKRTLGMKKQKLDERRTIPEHTITTQHMVTKAAAKMLPNLQTPMSEPVSIFLKPFPDDNPEGNCAMDNAQMGHYLDSSFSNDFSSKMLSVQLYNCEQCQRSFSDPNDFKKHIHEHANVSGDEEDADKPYKCSQCDRRFILKKSLKSHIRIHTGEKPFKCEICLRSYSNRDDLLQHYRMHRVSRPHRCDYCQRGFRSKHILISHIRVHTGEKPFKCDECQRCFSAASNLTRHMRVHTSEKPHKCDICARSFNEKSHLTRHVRSHTGERPFKCEICRRGFSDKSNMQRHVRRHKGEKSCKIVFKKND
ncbi:hypothetical protein PYW08_012319 [Mythimna loreyi]|uniref:Uncharacterized protein n=1 Tax=Mythimna loreyi TaxID=667449 RepID=A0ACC2PZT8_9NEOP|nr:hypothetical protein PYW08_012319 [Mythimna loreyi]